MDFHSWEANYGLAKLNKKIFILNKMSFEETCCGLLSGWMYEVFIKNTLILPKPRKTKKCL